MRALSLVGLSLLLSCSDPTAPRSELLAVASGANSLTLTNLTRVPVYYFVIDRDFAVLASIALCTQPDQCPRVPRRESVRVPHEDIAGFGPESREALVLHYLLVSSPSGGFQADSVRSIIAPLR